MKTTKYICTHCRFRFNVPLRVYDVFGTDSNGQTSKGLVCPRCGFDGFGEDTITILKSELKQYISLKRELEQASLKLTAMKARGEDTEQLYEMVENNKLRCMALLLKTQEYIYSIDDSLTRQIFELRYVKGLKWSGVAANLGGYYTEDYVRIMHDRYLKANS